MFNENDYEEVSTKVDFKYWKDMTEGELMHENPLLYQRYDEKELQGPKGKFLAKSFICQDVVTKDLVGLPHSGLLAWQFENELPESKLFKVVYKGKDEQGRHQTDFKPLVKKGEGFTPNKVVEEQAVQERVSKAQSLDDLE